MSSAPPKIAFYWCASCGGCEEAIIDLDEGLPELARAVDIVFWPAALDFKVRDVDALGDGEIAVSFINGAVRTDEQRAMSELLRRKSALVVAFGSCAHQGGIPGLANLTTRHEIFKTAYRCSPTVDNAEGVVPSKTATLDGAAFALPAFWEQVHTLDQVIPVDYYLPGCPPMPEGIAHAVQALLKGELPERGAVLGSDKALCDTCPRRRTKRPGTRIARLFRPHEIDIDPDRCFLEQGIICAGPATRSGCGEACINGNMPCTGCYGPPPGVADQGARLLAAIASLFDTGTREAAEALAAEIADPAGTFNRYSVPASILGRRVEKE